MTWYAQQVFAQPRPQVVAAIRALPGMRYAPLYHVPHLNEFAVEEQVVDGIQFEPEGAVDLHRTIRRGPQLPVGGLLVLRELGWPCADSAGEWFDDDVVSWEALAETGTKLSGPMAELDRLFAGAPEGWKEDAPPLEVLGALQAIAASTRSVLSYFACHMWGGDTQYAFAWVFDGERDTSLFYRAKLASDAEGQERNEFYTDIAGAFAIDATSRRLIVQGDVLSLVLLHHGLMLSDGYFELHRRSFPWQRYLLSGTLPEATE